MLTKEKTHVIFLLLFICQPGIEIEAQQNSEECKKAEVVAISDIEVGNLGLYFFGLPNPKFNTAIRVFNEKYKISVKGGGDIITEEAKCYNRIMEVAIKKKFGDDVFEKVKTSVDSIYASGGGDRELTYKGGDKVMQNIIYCRLNFLSTKTNEPKKQTVYIDITIDSDGKIENAGIVKGVSLTVDQEALKVTKFLTDWVPAIENGQKVKSRITIAIKFDPALKQQCE